jgi:hypothetical protein
MSEIAWERLPVTARRWAADFLIQIKSLPAGETAPGLIIQSPQGRAVPEIAG